MTIKKKNETVKQARKEHSELIELLLKNIKTKLKVEFNRAQRAAITEYREKRYINNDIWEAHQEKLYEISYIGFNKSLKAGYLRLMKTFVKANWTKKDNIDKFLTDLKQNFEEFAHIQATKSARAMLKTTKKTVDWLLEKYQESEKNAKEFNDFEAFIKKVMDEAKDRSVSRAVISGLSIIHGGINKGAEEGAELTIKNEQITNINKFWVTMQDNAVRDSHVLTHGQAVAHDLKFLVPDLKNGGTDSMRYPGDRDASIGNWINCRCTKLYRRD